MTQLANKTELLHLLREWQDDLIIERADCEAANNWTRFSEITGTLLKLQYLIEDLERELTHQ